MCVGLPPFTVRADTYENTFLSARPFPFAGIVESVRFSQVVNKAGRWPALFTSHGDSLLSKAVVQSRAVEIEDDEIAVVLDYRIRARMEDRVGTPNRVAWVSAVG